MPGRVVVSRSHALVRKGGTVAAATVVAGAGILGVGVAGPAISGASAVQVSYDVAPTAFPTFAASLQTLLNDLGLGDVNAVLGGFGSFTVGSSVSDFLAALNPDGLTLGGVGDLVGIPLIEPLYSTSADSILGHNGLWLVGGVPIGNLDLGGTGGVIDALLGAGAGAHSLTDLADAVGLGSMLSQFGSMINALGLDNLNVDNCTLTCGALANVTSHPGLNVNSSLNDWLSGILGKPTIDVTQHAFSGLGSTTVVANSAWTLGQYLHTLPVSSTDSTPMDQATLGQLFGLNPGQPWNEYLDNMPFGGTLLDPSGQTWGEQTLGTFLSSFLPDDSGLTIAGDTPVTAILEALGLLNW